MINSNMRARTKLKNRLIAFITVITMMVSMLSLTILALAEEGEHTPTDEVVEYTSAPQPEPEPQDPVDPVADADDEVYYGDDFVQDEEATYTEDHDYAEVEEYYGEDYEAEEYYDGEEYDTELFTLSNVPTGLTHIGQTADVYTSTVTADEEAYVAAVLFATPSILEVVSDTTVTLSAGDIAENHEFLGWYRGEEEPELGTMIYELDQSNFVASSNYSFEMPDEEVHYFGVWGFNGMIGRQIGPYAVWSISHETIPPTATTVAVRVSLDMNTADGMGMTILPITFENPFLSNPRIVPIRILDRDRFDAGMWILYGIFSETYTDEEMMAMPAFANAVVDTASYNAGFTPEHLAYPNHVLSANEFVLRWTPPGGMDEPFTDATIFAYVTFDVNPAANVGDVSLVEFYDRYLFMGWTLGAGDNPLLRQNLHGGSVTIADGEAQLDIANIPASLNYPTTQTASGLRVVGSSVTLAEGTHPADWQFFGWIRGDTLPGLNADFAQWQIDNPSVVVRPAGWQFTMPDADITYTAIWGNYVGGGNGNGNGNGGPPIVGGNLVVANQPPQNPVPQGQTLTQHVPFQGNVTLEPGADPTVPVALEFGGWVRGHVIPPVGVNFGVWIAANSTVFTTTVRAHPVTNFGETEVRTYTAIWVCENNIVGGGANLRIQNQPVQVPLPAGQTLTQQVDVGERVYLQEGAYPTDRYFGRWVRGDVIPPLGVHLNTWLAANPSVQNFPSGHRTNVFVAASEYTYTAVWVCEEGYVDGRGNLRIGNQPIRALPVSGQTLTQHVAAGNYVYITEGVAPADRFFGSWVRGDVIPPLGVHLERWLLANPTVESFPSGHRTNTFTEASIYRYTAVWVCEDGYVDGRGNLIIDNQPVRALPVPGQTPTQRVEIGGRVTLQAGEAPTDRYFGRWVRGDVIPPLGVHLNEWLGQNPSVQNFPAGHVTNIFTAASVYRYTAVWVCEDGYVDGPGNLRIHNQPTQAVRPTGQTMTQTVPVGQSRVLAHGTAPSGLFFGGWVRGDVIPPVGAIFGQWLAENPTVPNFGSGHRTNVFAEESIYIYTAIWVCVDDIVGGNANLRINNVPVQFVRPAGQTPTQVVPIGEYRTLAHGTAPSDLFFGTWIRGNVVPPIGVNLATWLEANPAVPNFDAGHTTNVFSVGSSYVYAAIWVCEHGIVGGGGSRYIRIYYYIEGDEENERVRDTDNNPYGRQYFPPIGSTFSLSHVLDRNTLPGNTTYAFEGWLVYLDGEPAMTYIPDKDVEELHGSFVVPAPSITTLAASFDAFNMDAATGYVITLVALWSAEEEKLPATGISSNIFLWMGLLFTTLLVAVAVIRIMAKSKRDAYNQCTLKP